MTLDDLAGAAPEKPKNRIGQKAVINGVLQSVSPSQIKTFSACPRSWWFDKVAGLRPEEEAAHLTTGSAYHKQQEDYYELGILPENESCRLALTLPGVPSRLCNDIAIEEPRDYGLGLCAAGIPMRGRIDLRAPPTNGGFVILDWKTCKNFKYCKTPEELAVDVQGIVYLKYGFTVYPEAKYGIFKHVYIRTEAVDAQLIETDPLDRNHVDTVYRQIEEVVEKIKVTAAIKEQDEVPFDKSACFAYGGCPYQKNCNAFKRKKETQEMPSLDNDFLSRMRAKQSGVVKEPEVKAQEVKAPSSGVDKIPTQETSIVPPDAPKPDKVEPGPEVKALLEDLRTGKRTEESIKYVAPEEDYYGTKLRLFIDCVPIKVTGDSYVHLENLIADRSFAVFKALEVKGVKIPEVCMDLRLIPYGQGVAELVNNFKLNPPTGLVLASSNGLSGVVAEALIPLATEVYKGVR
jgi:hypothetical protein